jgi:GR25 family glycosyltransferase involved in LPS biosynthesis
MEVFYINRSIDQSRKHSLVKILDEYPKNIIFSYHRVEAIDSQNFKLDEANPLLAPHLERDRKIKWYILIFLSHLKAILTFYHQSNNRYGLVMEDDADFIWSTVHWLRMIEQIEEERPNWEVIKIYRNFNRKYRECPGLFTPYLKAKRNCGAVAYLINRKAIERRYQRIDRMKLQFPDFSTINLDPVFKQFEHPVMDSERLLFSWLFNPEEVLQLNVPIVGHTYHFTSSKFSPDNPCQLKRVRQLSKIYYLYLIQQTVMPSYLRSINLRLFNPECHQDLIKRGLATRLPGATTNRVIDHSTKPSIKNALTRSSRIRVTGGRPKELHQERPPLVKQVIFRSGTQNFSVATR